MRLLAICLAALCLLGSAYGMPSHEETRAALAEGLLHARDQVAHLTKSVMTAAHSGVSYAHQSVAEVHHSIGFHSMGQPSGVCVAAVLQLNATVFASGCQNFLGVFSNNPLYNPAALTSQLPALCASNCLQLLANATAAVAVGCQSADAAALTADIGKFISFSNLLCTKDPNNPSMYCLAEFITAFGPFQNGANSVTTPQLQAFCTPCTYIILNGFVSSGAFSVQASANISAVSVLCSTDPVTGQYCVIELQASAQLFSGINGNNLPQLTNAQWEPICSSCTKKILAFVNSPIATATLAALCVMNGNNFCFVQDINAFSALANTNPSNTQQACNAFSTFVSKVGCCANAITGILAAVGGGQGSISGGISFGSLYALCNVNNPGACNAPSYTGTFSFVVTNLAYAYYQANMAAVNAAIVADVAFNVGVASSQVTVSSVAVYTANGQQVGVQITVTVTFTSSLESTTALGLFNSNTQNNNFPLTSVAQLGPVSRITPSSPVATSTSNTQASSNAPTYTNSPAAERAPVSMLVLAVAGFIALMFTQKH